MRVAIIYDCLYPYTVGGAERWCRALSEHLSKNHEVTYLTRRQWSEGELKPAKFKVTAVSPGGPLYSKSGERRSLPAVLFGLGTFWYLVRHGRRFDVISCVAFPFTSLFAAWIALKLNRSQAELVSDWPECWTKEYWVEYLGALAGRVGYLAQRICMNCTSTLFTFSQFVTERLLTEGYKGEIVRLPGLYDGTSSGLESVPALTPPYALFAGRHIPEKRVRLIPPAIAQARKKIPDLECKIFGEGPETDKLKIQVAELGLDNVIECSGFVSQSELEDAMRGSLCLILPSAREGYGMVVVEAAAIGVPVIVTEAADSAATELVEYGQNGYVAEANSDAISTQIVQIFQDGQALRAKTACWFKKNAEWLSAQNSAIKVESTLSALVAKRQTITKSATQSLT